MRCGRVPNLYSLSTRGGRNSRVEGDKDPLIKDHGAVAIRHADLTVGCMPVNDLSGGHIARIESGL